VLLVEVWQAEGGEASHGEGEANGRSSCNVFNPAQVGNGSDAQVPCQVQAGIAPAPVSPCDTGPAAWWWGGASAEPGQKVTWALITPTTTERCSNNGSVGEKSRDWPT